MRVTLDLTRTRRGPRAMAPMDAGGEDVPRAAPHGWSERDAEEDWWWSAWNFSSGRCLVCNDPIKAVRDTKGFYVPAPGAGEVVMAVGGLYQRWPVHVACVHGRRKGETRVLPHEDHPGVL